VTKSAKDIISLYRPYKTRKKAMYGLFSAMLSVGQESNQAKSIYARASDSVDQLDHSLAFLAGFMTLLPHLDLKRSVQLQDDGERLAQDAYAFLRSFSKPSVSKVRRLRVFNEKFPPEAEAFMFVLPLQDVLAYPAYLKVRVL
jgi:hypothetical protein